MSNASGFLNAAAFSTHQIFSRSGSSERNISAKLVKVNQSDKLRQYNEARLQFDAAAREFIEINNRAREAGEATNPEVEAAIQRLNVAQEKMQHAQAAVDRKFEPVALTSLVERKVNDTFAAPDRRAAIDLLINECGRNLPFKNDAIPKHLEQIRLAVLKLANGNLEQLRRHIQTAKSDWRDVILFAESPEFMRTGIVEFYRRDERSQAAVTQRDRQQYVAWLNSSLAVTRPFAWHWIRRIATKLFSSH